jgi:hypothetical protein
MTWRVARSLLVLRDQLDALYPGRSKASDGTIGDAAHAASVSDHNPDAAGVVRALDITHDVAHGCDIDLITDQLAAGRDPRISYLIANRLIMSGPAGPSPWVWRTYGGDDPHTNHFHLSVVADNRADDPTPWKLGTTTNKPTSSGEVPDGMQTFMIFKGEATVYQTNGITAWAIGSEDELRDRAYLAQEGSFMVNLDPNRSDVVKISGVPVRLVGRKALIGKVVNGS